jgi:hypothetical protein
MTGQASATSIALFPPGLTPHLSQTKLRVQFQHEATMSATIPLKVFWQPG